MREGEARVLSIVIPALDEEDAIGETLRRCLDAREHIVSTSSVDAVELIVVSDGSSDRTEEIARGFEEVTVLAFERNRGYGAAIQCGFASGRGELLAFLDADGTCDPRFFADLCAALDAEQADVVLGSRMGRDSEMPWLRSVGNSIFAWILGTLAHRRLEDTASGMRVLRRGALPDLLPLPDGLHFTPAMSARVLLEGRLKLVEVPMPYAERVGRSKLHVWKDGLRFLSAIVQAAIAYRPARPLLLVAALLGAGGLLVAGGPLRLYAVETRLEEWMIYRLLLASLLATVAAISVMAAVLAERIAAAAHGREPARSGVTAFVLNLFNRRNRRFATGLSFGVALWIAAPGALEYLATGRVEMHWSRAALASLLVVLGSVFGITTFLIHMLELIAAQREPPLRPRAADRVHPARSAGDVS